jgi:hypothetical protein
VSGSIATITISALRGAHETDAQMQVFFSTRSMNYLGDDEVGGLIATHMGRTTGRLQQIKAQI